MSSKVFQKEPILFCFCAPSASGKTTITKELVARDPSLILSLSTTTREPRAGELHGREYWFVSDDEFRRQVDAGEFLEHATFSGKSYGTGKQNLTTAKNSRADLILDIDVQGVEQLRRICPAQLVVVFVFPPSFDILRSRLRSRGSESPEKMAARLSAAEKEIAELGRPGFSDYLLINDELTGAVALAEHIVRAERARCSRLDFSKLIELPASGGASGSSSDPTCGPSSGPSSGPSR